jgi:2-methylcitrate dehydratase
LAAARLTRLDAERTRHALGIAGVAGTALRQSRVGELSHWKGCAFANAARHGVFAAWLARGGMTGPAPIFEGEKGFEKLVSGSLRELRLPGAGAAKDDFMILNTDIKFWPAEYHAQSAIEAVLKLRRQVGDPSEVESILVQSHDAAVDIIGSEPEKWRPTSRETADHSLPYMVAAALADGEITAKQFAPERFTETNLLALVQRVKVERDAELSALYPGAVGNIVTLRCRAGKTLTERVDYPHGHSRNPLTDAEVEAKFHQLADPVLGRERSQAVCRWVWALEKAESMSEMFRLLQVPATS